MALRLDFLSLKKRISLGFTLICGLLCIVGIISYFGFLQGKKQFAQFTHLNNQANLHIAIERNVLELQRQTLKFTYEGHEIAENKVYALCKSLNEELNAAEKSAPAGAAKKIIVKMIEHLNIYAKTFKDVAAERKLRNDFVQEKLRDHAENAEHALFEYVLSEKEEEDFTHSSKAQLLINGIITIEKNAFRYFDFLDSTLIAKAKQSFSSIQADLENLIMEEAEEAVNEQNESELKDKAFLMVAQNMIFEYEKALLRAVQATRGYLYLVNVVMAGEASEFLYNAKKLKNLSTKNMKTVEYQLTGLIERITFITVLVIIISVILASILSWLVGKSITAPVAQMTNTFKLLAKGDHQAQIPGHDFKDEIGDLSRAADVFKKKNRETEELLIKSRALTNELEEKREELAHSNEELEQFVYTVSHDLKSPLVTSMGFIGMVNDLAKKGEYEKAVSKLDRVARANTRMGQLINDLLELSRVGRVNLDKKSIDMNLMLKDFKDSLKLKLKQEKFELVLEDNLPTIYGNESRILQLFENLMSNAFKYAKNPSGNSRVKIGSVKDNYEYIFYVADNGQGVQKDYHNKIFGLFYRLDNTKEGTGIGLSVARKVMQFHEGRVWIESEPGHGATFWLAFPKTVKIL